MSLASRSPRRRTTPRQPSGPRLAARPPVIAPPEYAREAASVRRDLRWIAIWGGLLLVGLIAASFVL
jgi:hypothetical protein